MNEAAYIDWFDRARRNGVIEDAVRAYYMDAGLPLYRAELERGAVTLPVSVQPAWQESRETHIREDVRQMHSSYDDDAIEQRLRWVAAQASVDVDDLRGTLYNATTLRPIEMKRSDGQIIVGERDYLTQLAHHERMVRELGEALWEADVGVDAHGTRLSGVVSSLTLPRRDALGQTLDAILNHIRENCGYFGVHAATIVNTGNGYEVLSVDRDSTAFAYPNRQGTVPSGNIEPREHDSLETQMLAEEFVEEVLVTEWDETPEEASEPMNAFRKARDEGRIRIELTSMQLGLVGPDLTMNGVILVNDPAFYDEYIDGVVETCEEHDAVHARPLEDADAHAEFMRNKNVPTVHRAAQHEALCYLRDYGSVDVPSYGRSITQ